MSDQAQRDPMLAAGQLQDAVAESRRFITTLPEEALIEKACGPKEVLAHNVFWIESYVGQVAAILAGETPIPPQGRFDDLNAQAVAASRFRSPNCYSAIKRRASGSARWPELTTRKASSLCSKRALPAGIP